MKTIILDKPNQFTFTQTAPPADPAPDEALVQIHRVGICGTDLHAFRGRQPFFSYPRILGHELGCEIIALGANEAGFQAGDHCAIEPYLNCGQCIACRRGKTNCCTGMKVLGVHVDGGMRDLITVPLNKLHKSNTLPLEQLALVETLCIGAHAVSRAELEKDQFVLVIGLGPIGLSVAQFAHIAGAKVIGLDINQDRLNFCQEIIGNEYSVNAAQNPLETVQAITNKDMPLTVFDVTGNVKAMETSFAYVAHGGKLVFVGLVKDNITFHDPYFHSHEITLLSSRNATGADFRQVINSLENHKINLAPWITHQVPATEMIEAFPSWLEPETGVIKAVVSF